MGPKCSMLPTRNVAIVGSNNSPVIINGFNYNISSIFNTAVNAIMQKYRFELILTQFILVCLVVMSVLLAVRCLIPRSGIDKEKQSTIRENEKIVKMDILKYQEHFKQLDRALKDIESILKSNNKALPFLAPPLEYIENTYNLIRSSPHLLSIVVSKLVGGNYADLCVAVFKLKSGNPRQCNKSWQAITCALCGLCYYMETSPKLCIAAINAGVIPLFSSVLSQTSYLEELDNNPPVMYLFQMATRMFHNIAQIEELKYSLEKYNCCEILLNVISHTNNRLLKAISLLTAVRITRGGIHKVQFTGDNSSILFRLYYESVKSKDREAYGLKQDHILDGFYAIGQADCISYDFAHME